MSGFVSRFVSGIGPNWFASVMGTSIVASAAVTLPIRPYWIAAPAGAVWLLAVGWLLVLTVVFAAHWGRHRELACRHHADPVMMQFYGVPPMALLAVGGGATLLGPSIMGESAAVFLAAGLWLTGTAGGLWTTIAVPYVMFTRPAPPDGGVFAGWLLPVVPPMVSATTGAALVPHLPPGQSRGTLLAACYGMFGISLLATAIILPQLWFRLVRHGIGPAASVPILWVVLGPLGQSVTAAEHLGGVADLAMDGTSAAALRVFGLVYGFPVLGFALVWLGLVLALTVRTLRRDRRFAMTWWSFTFPLGTCVTGASAIAMHSGLIAATLLAVVLYALLLTGWTLAGVGTLRGLISGRLLPAAPQ